MTPRDSFSLSSSRRHPTPVARARALGAPTALATRVPGAAAMTRAGAVSTLGGSAVAALAAALLVGVAPSPAAAQFLEPDVEVVRQLDGAQVGDYFGWLTANIGDLDGDGLDEVVVGAIGHDAFAGRVVVFSGADGSELSSTVGAPSAAFGYGVGAAGDVDGDSIPDYIAGGGQTLVFSGADHSVLHDFSAQAGFSDAVGGAGDLDGDGFADLLVGAARTSTDLANVGRLYAFSGADGSLLWSRDGDAESDFLGVAVGAVGDVDRDRVPDVVVGVAAAGMADGGEALVLSGVDGSTIHTLQPPDPASAVSFATFFASGTGDLNGDRVGDIYIGDLAQGTGDRAGTGAAYIYSGRTGRLLHELRGSTVGEGFGLGRAIPDVDGDRRNDILVGAFSNSEGAPGAGKVYLYSGRSGALLRVITSDLEAANFGGDVAHSGDLDGDGLPDFTVTAPGRSFLGLEPGRAYVIAGTVLPCPADLSGDGWVGLRDLWLLHYALVRDDPSGDLDGDGFSDQRDLLVLARSLGRCAPGFPR